MLSIKVLNVRGAGVGSGGVGVRKLKMSVEGGSGAGEELKLSLGWESGTNTFSDVCDISVLPCDWVKDMFGDVGSASIGVAVEVVVGLIEVTRAETFAALFAALVVAASMRNLV